MKTSKSAILSLALMFSSAGVMVAQETAKQDMKHAGTETKEATKDTGHAIAHGTRTGARKTKNGTKRVVHGAARGTRRGAAKVEDKSAPTQ